MLSISVVMVALEYPRRHNRYDRVAIFASDVDTESCRDDISCTISGGMLVMRPGNEWPGEEELDVARLRSSEIRGSSWPVGFIPALLIGPSTKQRGSYPIWRTFALEHKGNTWIPYSGMMVPWLQMQALR